MIHYHASTLISTATCAPVTCYMHCEHGWQRDENGCEICKCNRPPKGEYLMLNSSFQK